MDPNDWTDILEILEMLDWKLRSAPYHLKVKAFLFWYGLSQGLCIEMHFWINRTTDLQKNQNFFKV